MGARFYSRRMDRSNVAAGERLLFLAAVAAFAHAIPSLYWAAGGTLGISLLGEWAPAWRAENPVLVPVLLIVIFVAKAAGGVVPLLATRRLIPWPRMWRALSWAGAITLVLYGAANIVVGGLALTGIIDGPIDEAARTALLGHVLLWDLIFLLWGVLLTAGLAATRKSFAVGGAVPSDLVGAAR